MATSTRRGFGHIITKLAFISLLVAGFKLSAVTNVVVEAGQTFTFEPPNRVYNSETYELVVNAGATIQLPPSGNFHAFVYMKGEGTVTFKKPDTYNGGDQVSFKNGIAAESTVNVVIEDVTTVNVGRVSASGDVHYPVVDVAKMEFKQEGGKLVLTDKCTARTLPSSFEVASGATVALQGTNPLRLGSDFALTDYDIVVLMQTAIPDGCTIAVPPGRTLGLKPAITAKRDSGEAASTYNWNWSGCDSYFDESLNIVLGGKGAKVRCRSTATRLCLFTPVTGTGEVLFMPDSNEANSRLVFHGVAYVATKSNPVVVPVNTAADPVVSDAWKSKVAHWFDASDAETVIKYTFTKAGSSLRNNFEGKYPVVVGWLDHVKGHSDKFLYSRDAINGHYPYWLPYLVEGGLNGKDYLSFGVYYQDADMSQVDSQDCPDGKHVQRFIQFVDPSTSAVVGDKKPSGSYTTIADCKYCIMVFGSQFGGGKSILGDQKQQSSDVPLGNLARNSSKINQPWLAYNGYSMMVDGVGISPKTAKPNGGWQIISLDMSATNTVLDCLGGHNVTTYGGSLFDGRKTELTGGQNYAEVLLFNEVPTDAERIACEAYLANKWGLISTHSARAEKEVFSDISGGTGTTMTLADYDYTENNVNVTYPTPAEVTIAGNYRGTINIAAGKTLVVSDRPAPLDAYDIPQQENIAAWFDPSFDGATDPHGNADVAAGGGIARLYSRTAGAVDKTDGSFYLAMQGSALDSANTRYPFLLETSYSGAHGIADTMKWLDFTVNWTGDTTSNNLRSHLMPAVDSHITEKIVDKLPAVRSVFMSIDTSVGGGNPIADTVAMNGMFSPRNGTSAANPIWSTDNTVTMAHTWLDTNEVDGTTHGFNGRGEVLGFEMSEAKRMAVVLAYYNQGSNKNYEHIGETIIYSTTLSDAERLTVQEYLMAKWTGDMNGKYSDLSGATVTGAGNVKSAALRNLPQFDAGFTGVLSGGSSMTFTIDPLLNASAALDAITIDRAVTLDSVCTVTVTLKGKAKSGTYTLLTVPSGSLVGKTFALNVVNETEERLVAKLVTSDTTLSLETAPPPGLVVLIR